MPSLDKAVSPAAPAQPDISETAAEAPPGNRFPPGAMEIKVEPRYPAHASDYPMETCHDGDLAA